TTSSRSTASSSAHPRKGSDMSYPTTIISDELALWAMQNKCVITDGEVGFGRRCVGLMLGDHWVDYDYDQGIVNDHAPIDAYHKHTCLCVLDHDNTDEAWLQFAGWLTAIVAGGYMVVEVPRVPTDAIDLLIHGTSTPRLVKP